MRALSLLIATRCGKESNEANEVRGETSSDLPQLIFGIFVFAQGARCSSPLLFIDKDRRGDARQDQTSEQGERKSLMLIRDDGSQESTDHRQANDAELADLQSPQARRRISGKGKEKHHLGVSR